MTGETSDKVASIAARGLTKPGDLTEGEVQAVCASALAQRTADQAQAEPAPAPAIDRDALAGERAELARKLTRRENQPGFAANADLIRARLAEIDATLAEAS